MMRKGLHGKGCLLFREGACIDFAGEICSQDARRKPHKFWPHALAYVMHVCIHPQTKWLADIHMTVAVEVRGVHPEKQALALYVHENNTQRHAHTQRDENLHVRIYIHACTSIRIYSQNIATSESATLTNQGSRVYN